MIGSAFRMASRAVLSRRWRSRIPGIVTLAVVGALLALAGNATAASRARAWPRVDFPPPAALKSADYRRQISTGRQNTFIQLMNVGQQPSTVVVDYYKDDGTFVAEDPPATVAANGPLSIFQSTNNRLPPGFFGTAVISSDQPFRAVITTNVQDGNQISLGAENIPTHGAVVQYLPTVQKNFFGMQTMVLVQNLDDQQAACVRVLLRSNRGDGQQIDYQDPALQGSPDCPNAGNRVAPHGQLTMAPEDLPATVFSGAATVVSLQNSAKQTPLLAASARVWNSSGRQLLAYNGFIDGAPSVDPSSCTASTPPHGNVGGDDVATKVLAPIAWKLAGGNHDFYSWFQIFNTDPCLPATVTASYFGPNVPLGSVTHQFTVPPLGSWGETPVFIPQLPAGFVGSAVLTSDRPIAVTVVRQRLASDLVTATNGVPADPGDNPPSGFYGSTPLYIYYVPLAYSHYHALSGMLGWNSWVMVQTFDGSAANFQTLFTGNDPDGVCPSGQWSNANMRVNGSGIFYQSILNGFPPGVNLPCFVGSLRIVATQPLAIMANVTTDMYAGDTDAGYNAIPGGP